MFKRREFECKIVRDIILINDSSRIRNVSISDIVLLKTIKCYTSLQISISEDFLTSDTLTSFEERLPSSFFRVSRNVIVNMDYVEMIQKKNSRHFVKLKMGETVEISRRRVKGFVECFQKFLCDSY